MRLEVFGEVLSQLIDPKDIHALPQNQSMILIFLLLLCIYDLSNRVTLLIFPFLGLKLNTPDQTLNINNICPDGGIHLSGKIFSLNFESKLFIQINYILICRKYKSRTAYNRSRW